MAKNCTSATETPKPLFERIGHVEEIGARYRRGTLAALTISNWKVVL
jgi:hypothetical protein